MDKQKDEIKNNLKIIHTTARVPPHPFVVHPRVRREVAEKVKTALLSMGATESGRKMLLQIPVKNIGAADITDYLILEKMGLERFYVKQY